MIIHDILLANPKERLKVFEKYCSALANAINNNDVGLVNAIYSSMNAAEIKRLKLPDQVKNKHDIKSLMFIAEKVVSSDESYKAQRKIEAQAAQNKQAIIPSITTLLNDLTFSHDGNLDANGNLKPAGKEKMDEIIAQFAVKQALAKNALKAGHVSIFANRISNTAYVLDSRTGMKRSEEIMPSNNKKSPKAAEMKSIEFYLMERLEKISSNLNSNITAMNLTFERISKRMNDIAILIEENALTKEEHEKFISLMIASEGIQGLTKSIREAEATLEAMEKFSKENPETPDLAKLSAACIELKKDIAIGWQMIEDIKIRQKELKEAQAKATEHREKVQPQVDIQPLEEAPEITIPDDAEEAPEITIPDDAEAELPAERKLESLLKQYSIKVYEIQNTKLAKAKQEQLARMIKHLEEQINDVINSVRADSRSNDPQVKSAAAMTTAKMKNMIEKYQELHNFLQTAKSSHVEKPTNSRAAKIKRAVTKMKKSHREKTTANPIEKSKDLLGLINALREETHKRTHEESLQYQANKPAVEQANRPQAKPELKSILVQPGAQRKAKHKVHFIDDEVQSSVEPSAMEPSAMEPSAMEPSAMEPSAMEPSAMEPSAMEPSAMEPSAMEPSVPTAGSAKVREQPQNPPFEPVAEFTRTAKTSVTTSQHRVAFSNDLLALENLKAKLSNNDHNVRNLARMQAMKQSVEILKNLPSTHKPKNFSDIVKFATTNVSDWQNIQEVKRKKASEVVLAVIVAPNASVEDLKITQRQLQARVEVLKKMQPLTQEIKNKIILRKAVLLHVDNLIFEKSVAHQPRPSAVRLSAMNLMESIATSADSEAKAENVGTKNKSDKLGSKNNRGT